MKKLSVALAAVLLTAAPIALAHAEEHAAPTEAAAPAAETMTKSVTLADGTVVQIEGDMVYVVDSYGEKKAAPDGEHKAADGTTIVVKEGKLVTTPATEAPASTEEKAPE